MSAIRPIAFFTVVLVAESAHAAAIDQVAKNSLEQLSKVGTGVTCVVASLITDVTATDPEGLRARVARAIAMQWGRRAHVEPKSHTMAQAELVAQKKHVLFVQPEIRNGELLLRVRTLQPRGNVWDRSVDRSPITSKEALVRVRVDSEIRAFLRPILLEEAKSTTFLQPLGRVSALACGDVRNDGSLELIAVTTSRVSIASLRQGAFHEIESLAWPRELALLPARLREPLAVVEVTENGALGIGHSDRGFSTWDDGVWKSEKTWRLDATGVVNFRYQIGRPKSAFITVTPPTGLDVQVFDAIAGTEFASLGLTLRAFALREPSGRLYVMVGNNAPVILDDVGAQVALGDLDLDGVLEVVTTSNGASERLRVVSLTAGAPKIRWEQESADPIRSVTVCPPEAASKPSIVAVTDRQVWRVW